MTSTHDFPTTGVELKYLLVVSVYARSLAFYRDVLGATLVREISDVLCLLSFGGGEIMLTVGGGPTKRCFLAEPNSSRRLSIGATRSEPSSATLMAISLRSRRAASRSERHQDIMGYSNHVLML